MTKLLRFVFALLFCLIWAYLWEVLTNYLGFPYEIEEEPTLQYTIFYTFLFAPIWEELAYRYGPIEISKKLGKQTLLPIIVMSSCVFGWGHYGHEGVLLQGVLGLVFSWIYLKNGLLWSVLLHSLYNIITWI